MFMLFRAFTFLTEIKVFANWALISDTDNRIAIATVASDIKVNSLVFQFLVLEVVWDLGWQFRNQVFQELDDFFSLAIFTVLSFSFTCMVTLIKLISFFLFVHLNNVELDGSLVLAFV